MSSSAVPPTRKRSGGLYPIERCLSGRVEASGGTMHAYSVPVQHRAANRGGDRARWGRPARRGGCRDRRWEDKSGENSYDRVSWRPVSPVLGVS
jgi:hypothetical protein